MRCREINCQQFEKLLSVTSCIVLAGESDSNGGACQDIPRYGRSQRSQYQTFRRVITTSNMVKPLSFKGDKKVKKRKRVDTEEKFGDDVASSSKKQVTTTTKEDEQVEDDTWVTAEAVTDIVGPIIIVLPSDSPSCLACDTNGKVFPSALENLIDGDPATAEPHEVRQVWIANRVAGTETFSFKGHHGK